MAAVELEGIEKRYGALLALRGISLALTEHQTTAIIGPSGCGKSTLLRIINGLIQPDAGQVQVLGERLSNEPAERRAQLRRVRLKAAYMIQGGGLFPHMSARRNITLMAEWTGRSAGEIDRRLAELIALTRFPPQALDRFPSNLSGGQRQRVSLMRALFLDPVLVLLDEPLGALDPMIRRELQEELKGIFTGLGKTVCLVTHDLAEAAFFADRIVLMKDGRILQQGPLASLLGEPADPFVTHFVNAQRPPVEAFR
jgi:osmoprotectant transport system ATP-binding protein